MKEMLMSLLNFRRKEAPAFELPTPEVAAFLQDYSIEVMPRTAEKVEDFRDLLPEGTRVYIAHIDGTPIEDMVATAARLNADGYKVMPHFPARIIKDRATLENWIAMYQGEADVKQGLLLAGGVTTPHGDFSDSMQLMDTGLFDKHGFERLHIAGHPEGNRDIDTDGTRLRVDDALRWKQGFSERTDAKMAIATQFAFEAQPIIEWAESLKHAGIDLPIHIACGVGPSLKVLQKRAMDVTKLLLPYEPTDVITELAAHKAANPDFNITHVHFFPLGGIKTNANWAIENGGPAAHPANSV